MGLKKKKEMIKMLVLALSLMMAFTVEARFDANTLVGQMFKENYGGEAKYLMKSTTTACCDKCFCTKWKTPQCHSETLEKLATPPASSASVLSVILLSVVALNFCYPPCSSPDKPRMIMTI